MTLCRSLALVLAFQFLVLTSLWSQATKEKADLIVTRGTVVTMDGARSIYDDGIIVVKGDTIVAVGPRRELEGKYRASETVNAKGGRVDRKSTRLNSSHRCISYAVFCLKK